MDAEKGHTEMTTEQSGSAETGSDPTTVGESPREEARKQATPTGEFAPGTRPSIPVPVRRAAGRTAARARHLTGRGMARARRNPRTVAVAVAGATASVLAAWRRITRRGHRR
jgi:hypothetical protein